MNCFKKMFLIVACMGLFSAFGEKEKNKNTIIINNKNKAQTVTAPALVPAKSKKIRSIREEAEIQTESIIIQKLEKERLRDEQKRIKRIFGETVSEESKQPAVATPVTSTTPVFSFLDSDWFNRAFISLGVGSIQYPGAENINSFHFPSFFFSFGGYSYGYFIVDLSVYYSEHFITPVTTDLVPTDQNVREGVYQPAVSMAIKLSPFKGRVKPYIGITGSYVARRWFVVDKAGALLEHYEDRDIALKKWRQSFDGGVALGADIGLMSHVGINVDLRYYKNIYTETPVDLEDIVQVLDKRDSIVLSGSLRYYF